MIHLDFCLCFLLFSSNNLSFGSMKICRLVILAVDVLWWSHRMDRVDGTEGNQTAFRTAQSSWDLVTGLFPELSAVHRTWQVVGLWMHGLISSYKSVHFTKAPQTITSPGQHPEDWCFSGHLMTLPADHLTSFRIHLFFWQYWVE